MTAQNNRGRRPEHRRSESRRPEHRRPEAGGDVVQPARLAAFEVLSAVSAQDAYANLLLPSTIATHRLNTADAALATELSYGTLRMRGYYDRVIALAAGRDIAQIDPPVLDVLRLGVHQLLSTRVATHAAVNESVALARRAASRSSAGFVNGVLRTVTRSTPDEWQARVLDPIDSDDEQLSARYSHPSWIVRALRQSLASEGRADELEQVLSADNDAPRVNMVALPGLAERPEDAAANSFSPHGFVLASGDPDGLVRASSGTLRVQDEGSQLAALALSRARAIVSGERWLDLCAGPGGKTALLAAEAHAGGASVTANEVVPARAELVKRAVAPLTNPVEVIVGDGTILGEQQPDSFDRVLVDAPCTGLGALRRRPEARWRKQPKDVAELATLQSQLLASAIAATKPGGLIAYVTCSPHLGETRAIVADALRRSEGAVTSIDTPGIVRAISGEPIDLGEIDETRAPVIRSVQLWPHRHGTDAMYIALLEKAPVAP